MANTSTFTEILTDIADAIRECDGTTDPINAQELSSRILEIGGGIPGVDFIDGIEAESISFSGTEIDNVITLNLWDLCNYPYIVVAIENTDAASDPQKLMRSLTIMANTSYASGGVDRDQTCTCIQHYYNSSGDLVTILGIGLGLWADYFNKYNRLFINGRCSAKQIPDLTGIYKILVLGIKL